MNVSGELIAKKTQEYTNLFPADRACNRNKSSTWPNEKDRRSGISFLNCCKKNDYDEQSFEDPRTHRLVGVTPAARFHIRVIGLNDRFLVDYRSERAKIHRKLNEVALKIKAGAQTEFVTCVEALRERVELMIPLILPPPE